MLSKEQKKQATDQFRERKQMLGVYAVRCTATGQVWVGSSRNLDASRNGIWFSLRLGHHRDKALQDEWNARGEAAFEYEMLETLPDGVSPLLIPDLLKDTKKRWMAKLQASGLL